MNYQVFQKVFFPQLCHAQADEREGDDMDSQKGDEERQARQQLQINKEDQPRIVQDRIHRIEKLLRQKLSTNYQTVRQAFLALDTDHDGFVTIEDFLRNFGDETGFTFMDLKKLIESKNAWRQGRISYDDFSAWVGQSIHMSEGFYFRHDSVKNPQYEA